MNRLLFMGRKTYGAQALEWSVKNGWEVIAVLTDDHQNTSPTARVGKSLGLKLLDYDGLMDEIASNNEMESCLFPETPRNLKPKQYLLSN